MDWASYSLLQVNRPRETNLFNFKVNLQDSINGKVETLFFGYFNFVVLNSCLTLVLLQELKQIIYMNILRFSFMVLKFWQWSERRDQTCNICNVSYKRLYIEKTYFILQYLLFILHVVFVYSEAATGGVLEKKVFLEISQNWPKNTYARDSFLINVQALGLRPAPFLKRNLWHRCFPVNFAKFLGIC